MTATEPSCLNQARPDADPRLAVRPCARVMAVLGGLLAALFATGCEAVVSGGASGQPTFQLAISPTVVDIGQGAALTVVLLDADGLVDTAATPTVRITSTDTGATLPPDYTFTLVDAGVHIFSGLTFSAAGSFMITVEDLSGARPTYSIGISVNPSGATAFEVSGIDDPCTAGSLQTFTVRAVDAIGQTVTNYTGTVSFTSNDSGATLPASHAFTPADLGVVTFVDQLTFVTPGLRTLTASDSAIMGAQTVAVTSASGLDLRIENFAATQIANVNFSVRVSVYDSLGLPATGYTGTIVFSSSDPQAVLPGPSYTFGPGDAGTRQFNALKLRTAGTQTLTVTDIAAGATPATESTDVQHGPPASMVFTQQPATGPITQPITPAPSVTVYDAFGNPATTASLTISIGLRNNPLKGALLGTTQIATTTGYAEFTDLRVSFPGNGYALRAHGAGPGTGDSDLFDILPAPNGPRIHTITVPPQPVGGVIPITYTVSQPQSEPVDIVVEFNIFGAWMRCIPAPSPIGERALFGVESAPAPGVSNTFYWDSTRGSSTFSLPTTELRIIPFHNSVPGTPLMVIIDLLNRVQFSAVGSSPTGAPDSIAVGDMDRDGNDDAVVASSTLGTLTVRSGNGAGAFPTTLSSRSVGLGARAVALADINRDGALDVLVICEVSATLEVMIGDGNGGIGAPTTFSVGAGARAMAVGDIDRDGLVDVVVANSGAANVSVFLNGTALDGTTPVFTAQTPVPVGAVRDVALGDLNNDGRLDLITIPTTGNTLQSLLGNGAGGFSAQGSIAMGAAPVRVFAADFNRDGLLDALTIDSGANTVTMAFGDGTGGFTNTWDVGTQGNSPVDAVVADFDRDGLLDVAVLHAGDDTIRVLTAYSWGALESKITIALARTATRLAAGDVDNSGFPDLVATATGGGGLDSFVAAPPSIGGTDAYVAPAANLQVVSPWAFTLAHVNDDGKIDAVLLSELGTITVAYGDGARGFVLGPASPTPGMIGRAIAAGDLDGDGDTDLVVAEDDTNIATVLIGDGGGNFAIGTSYPIGDNAITLVLADVNGDTDLDLLVGYASGTTYVSIRHGTSGAGFGTENQLATPWAPSSIAVGRLNADAFADIVVGGAAVGLYMSNGSGGYTFTTIPSVSGGVVVVDWNADTHDDFIVDGTEFYINDSGGTGTFTISTTGGTGGTPFRAADLDGDSHMDLAIMRSTLRFEASFYENGTLVLPDTFFRADVSPRAFDLGDVDQDGLLDIVYLDRHAEALLVSRQLSARSFDRPLFTDVPFGNVTTHLATGNIDNDGNTDLLLSKSYMTGTGTFSSFGGMFATSVTLGSDNGACAILDVNLDGIPDLATHDNTGGVANVRIWLRDGAGGYLSVSNIALPSGDALDGLAVADFNRDGRPDLAILQSTATALHVALNTTPPDATTQSFTLLPVITSGPRIESISVGDIDRDGRPDIVCGRSSTINVLLGNGAGAFASSTVTPTGIARFVVLADANGDGWLDLVHEDDRNVSGSYITTRTNFGGAFGPEQITRFQTSGNPLLSLAAGDMDRDGCDDVMFACDRSNGVVRLLIADGTGLFPTQLLLATAESELEAVALMDQNRDGRLDIVVGEDDVYMLLQR